MLLKTKDREKLTRLEPRMFMKTNEIVELTWNVTENKRVVRGPWSVARRRIPCDVPDFSVLEVLNLVVNE